MPLNETHFLSYKPVDEPLPSEVLSTPDDDPVLEIAQHIRAGADLAKTPRKPWMRPRD